MSGPEFPVARNIEYDTFVQCGMFSACTQGTLVYAGEGAGVNTQLTWLDRQGNTLGLLGESQQLICPCVSPDRKRVAVSTKPSDAREKTWIYDVDHGTRTPVESSESGSSLYRPTWSPDGTQVAYRDRVGKSSALLVHASDGSGDVKQPGGIHADLIQATD